MHTEALQIFRRACKYYWRYSSHLAALLRLVQKMKEFHHLMSGAGSRFRKFRGTSNVVELRTSSARYTFARSAECEIEISAAPLPIPFSDTLILLPRWGRSSLGVNCHLRVLLRVLLGAYRMRSGLPPGKFKVLTENLKYWRANWKI
jgi:hypothetical protein